MFKKNIKTILIAPDKFKGSMTATEFCNIAKETILSSYPSVSVICCPLADGGEGSLECIKSITGATIHSGLYSNECFQKATAQFAIKGERAFIELAETSGLYKAKRKDPCKNTTLGFGEQIKDAISLGAKKIYLFLGGSSTNDAGCGMAAGLGYRFLDEDGKEFIPVGDTLSKISKIIPPEPSLDKIRFYTVCDVTNPLFGEDGAAKVYARQKGASDEQIILLDNNLKAFNEVCLKLGKDLSHIPGGGSAGGLGAGTVMFLNSVIESGAESFFEISRIQKLIDSADLIITGEGRIDNQSRCGKVVFKLREIAKNVVFIAFCGENKLSSNFSDPPDFEIIEINSPGESPEESLLHTPANFKRKLAEKLKNIIN